MQLSQCLHLLLGGLFRARANVRRRLWKHILPELPQKATFSAEHSF